MLFQASSATVHESTHETLTIHFPRTKSMFTWCLNSGFSVSSYGVESLQCQDLNLNTEESPKSTMLNVDESSR